MDLYTACEESYKNGYARGWAERDVLLVAKIEYENGIYYCGNSNCGIRIESFYHFCPYCGYRILK